MDVRVTARIYHEDGPRVVHMVMRVPNSDYLPELTPEQLEELLAMSFDEDTQVPRTRSMPECELDALAPRERYCLREMGDVTCTVCLDEYTHRTCRYVRRLSCGHTFCSGCIVKWVSRHSASCPTCRKDLVPQ